MAQAPDEGGKAVGGHAKRVRNTGIALVHRDELVLPAAGSAAAAAVVGNDDRTVIHYHFPVEIEVRHVGAPVDVDQIVASAFDELASHLSNLT